MKLFYLSPTMTSWRSIYVMYNDISVLRRDCNYWSLFKHCYLILL